MNQNDYYRPMAYIKLQYKIHFWKNPTLDNCDNLVWNILICLKNDGRD